MMSELKYSVLIAFLLTLAGCEKPADLDNPKGYEKNGVSFSMPGNWKVSEDDEENGVRFLFVETPGDALFFVSIQQKEIAGSLFDFSDQVIDSSIEAFPIGSRNKGSMDKIEQQFGCKTYIGYKNEFIATVFGTDVPHVAVFYSVYAETKTAFIGTQVSTEDQAKVQKGFDLIISTFSLL